MRATVLFFALAAAAWAGEVPGQSIRRALFELKEMDMHLHAGLERGADLDPWLDLAVADGRKVIVVLDHLELYRPSDRKKTFAVTYPTGPAGHKTLMDDFDALAARRKDAILFKGWEVYEGELDTGVEPDPMRMADVIGWHISPNHSGQPPDGGTLIKRIRQILEIQKRFPVPMIVFHPFTMRLEHIQRKAKAAGRDVKAILPGEYRFFTARQQAEVAHLLQGTSVYIEISNAQAQYINDPACREALIADIKPLVEAGVQFTVSTDNHSVASAKKPFVPEEYTSLYGVTPFNTNTIVRELLAMKAKRGLIRGASGK